MLRKHKFIKTETKSEPYDPKLFGGNIQVTQTVNVSIEEANDDAADCLAGCFRCCIGAAKTAVK